MHTNYLILRFKNAEKAYKIDQDQPTIFTFKKIVEEGKEQLQIHLRFEGKDHWHGLEDNIDLDIYVPWNIAEGLGGSLCTFSSKHSDGTVHAHRLDSFF